jgi:hypothetical protein
MTQPPAEDSDPGHPRSSPFDHELSTDPGRPHPYESLYRNSGQSDRPTPRHWEPSLRPPADEDRVGDTYGWLYREKPADPPEPEDSQPADAQPLPPMVDDHPTKSTAPDLGLPAEPGAFAPARPPIRRRHNPAVVVVLIALVLILIAAVVVGAMVLRERTGNQAGAAAGPGSSTGQPSSLADQGSAGDLVAVTPTRATADCQAPAATDGGGKPVSYEPSLMLDSDPDTAWRCDGSGVGHAVVFTFPAGTRLAQVGLVNGYTKMDATTGEDRYPEYRRIRSVTWTFPGGGSVQQSLTGDDRAAQTAQIPAQEATEVTLTIDSSSRPGRKASSRDAVLISGVAFAALRA